jgi:hypothetical protein
MPVPFGRAKSVVSVLQHAVAWQPMRVYLLHCILLKQLHFYCSRLANMYVEFLKPGRASPLAWQVTDHIRHSRRTLPHRRDIQVLERAPRWNRLSTKIWKTIFTTNKTSGHKLGTNRSRDFNQKEMQSIRLEKYNETKQFRKLNARVINTSVACRWQSTHITHLTIDRKKY